MSAPAILAALCSACIAAAAQAFDPESTPRHGPRRPPIEEILERHAERLGLDAAALAEIRAIADAARPEGENLAAEVHEQRRELRALLDVDAPDLDAALRQVERVGEAEIALDKHRLRTMIDIRARLTPAQRSELVQIHRERRREHR